MGVQQFRDFCCLDGLNSSLAQEAVQTDSSLTTLGSWAGGQTHDKH